jgi:HEAT repeat protein
LAFLLSPCLLVSLSPDLPLYAAADWDEAIDRVMYQSPELPLARRVSVFDARLKPLWLEALARPEADAQCQAALAIATARGEGMLGLETTVAPLVAMLARADLHPEVRLAVARALIALDARSEAAALWRQAQQGDSDLRALVEPALARWDYRPARQVWLERLRQQAPARGSLVLAIQGLAAVVEEQAVPRLRDLVLSRTLAAPIRLEAARALGVLRRAVSEADARALAAVRGPQGLVSRLAAAALLRRHQGEAAVQLLQGLARDAEPAVATTALARLMELDPKLVEPALPQLLASPDAGVRSYAVAVMAQLPSTAYVRLLGDRLVDAHPEVRVKARKALHALAAQPAYRDRVLAQGQRHLAGSDWRGQEQAVVLLTQLEQKATAGRLVELLASERPEVFVAAAWGLRKLAVADTLPAVSRHVQRRYEQLVARGGVGVPELVRPVDEQLAQLIQFLGQSRYQPADQVLQAILPRMLGPNQLNPAGFETRAATAWALGLIHEDKSVPELVRALEGRLTHVSGRAPEDLRVRRMSAIALGRMKAQATLGSLRRFFNDGQPYLDVVSSACGWAIHRLTGEKLPPMGTVAVSVEHWFLRPAGLADRGVQDPDLRPLGGPPRR